MFVQHGCAPIAFVIVAELVVDMKNKGIKKSTFRIAFCSIISSLALVMMMITSIIPIGTFAFPCFAGIVITAIVVEFGHKWALGSYIVVALLSVFLAGDKEAVIYFIALFGYYPIVKGAIEGKLKRGFVQHIIKLVIFNIAAVGSFFVAMWLLSIPAEEFELFGVYVPWVFLIAGNIFFVLYDYTVSVLVTQYINRLRGKLFKKF